MRAIGLSSSKIGEARGQAGPLHRRLDRQLRTPRRHPGGRGRPRREQRPIDRNRQVQRRSLDELGAVDVPPQRRGGDVQCTPGSGGGIPITPRNGRRSTSRPNWSRPVPASGSTARRVSASRRPPRPDARSAESTSRLFGYAPSADPQLLEVDRQRAPGPCATHLNGAEQRVAGVELLVARLEMFTGPGVVGGRANPPPASGTKKATESPGSIVTAGGRSGEKCPCRFLRSSGSSWSATSTRAACRPRPRP